MDALDNIFYFTLFPDRSYIPTVEGVLRVWVKFSSTGRVRRRARHKRRDSLVLSPIHKQETDFFSRLKLRASGFKDLSHVRHTLTSRKSFVICAVGTEVTRMFGTKYSKLANAVTALSLLSVCRHVAPSRCMHFKEALAMCRRKVYWNSMKPMDRIISGIKTTLLLIACGNTATCSVFSGACASVFHWPLCITRTYLTLPCPYLFGLLTFFIFFPVTPPSWSLFAQFFLVGVPSLTLAAASSCLTTYQHGYLSTMIMFKAISFIMQSPKTVPFN